MESSRSSVRADPDLEVWPTDIFGVEPPGADIAHLIPHSPVHASAYFDVVRCAFGFDHTANWRTLQKAIHGSRLRSDSTLQRNTGIKHRVPNKIRLSHQARFFDLRPCVLVVPIMDLDAAKAWSGGGYDAIVMVEKWGVEERSTLAPIRSETVCLRIGMTTPAVRTARPQEIEVARTLLTQVLQGLAHSLAHRTKDRELVPKGSVRKLCKEGRKLLRSAGNGVTVPVASSTPPSDLRVYVVHFVDAFGTDNLNAHPAPDPFLLAVRAAVTWSTRNNQPLLAAAEPKDFEGDWDELDQLAIDEHLEERDRRVRPQSDYDLARGLGQLDRYYRTAGVSAR
jgi:hypothetical protein